MADLMSFSVTPIGPGAVQTTRATITALVVDSDDQSVVIADFTGNNALAFPAVIKDLTTQQQNAIIDMVAYYVVLAKAGLWEG